MSSKFQRLSDFKRTSSKSSDPFIFLKKDHFFPPNINIYYYTHCNNASFSTRYLSRCIYTGRTKGVFSKYRMTRMVFKSFASHGLIPGVFKSSW